MALHNLPADPMARLIWVAKAIVLDATASAIEKRKPAVFAGMLCALARVYEGITGKNAADLGPRKLIDWAMELTWSENIEVH